MVTFLPWRHGNTIPEMPQLRANEAPEGTIGERTITEVISILETGGPNALVLAEVARRARVSLRDVYRLFGSRDDLMVTAVGEWMDTNAYKGLSGPVPDELLLDALMRQFRRIFEPWEQNPRMLESYVYATSTANGERLLEQGFDAGGPAFAPLLADLDADFVEDLVLVMTHVPSSLIVRVAAGQLSITEVMPTIERILRRLVADIPLRAPAFDRARGGV